MTLSTKFNFKFATLQKYSSNKKTLNTALNSTKSTKKEMKGNKEFYNLTSSNISKLAKRKNTISRKHQIIINDISIHIKNKMSKRFHRQKIKFHNNATTNKHDMKKIGQQLKSNNNDRSNVH
jgi:hypothetical protein